MKKLILLLIIAFSISYNISAQSTKKAELCSDYNKTTGVPTGVGKYWDVINDGLGSNVYLIYTQDKLIKEDLTLYLDRKNANGSYVAYGTYYFNNDIKVSPAKWAMYDVNFKEEGDYRLTVTGKNADALAVTYADIKFIKDKSNNTAKTTKSGDVDDTYYYEDSKVTFGESIQDGKLSGEAATFSLIGESKEITAKIEQDDDLKLTLIYVDIYTGDDYKEKVSSLSYDVEDITWNWISTPIKFYKKGKYVVDFYTQDDVFINSGYFEVK